jgi:5-methyltetrahydropteroyltriglutamate--homocysteine methyltransferase
MAGTILKTQEIGSFRKPAYLSSRFHLSDESEIVPMKEKATLETLDVFRKVGMENLGVGGEMFRWEMYEHFAQFVAGLEFYGMVRSFDNRYYRKGSIISGLSRRSTLHGNELKFLLKNTTEELKMPVTGPYTMMDWSFNEHYRDRHEAALAFSKILNDEIRDLKRIWLNSRPGEEFQVQIDEPATTTHPSEMDIVVDSINRAVEGIDGVEFSLHVCYSKDYRVLYDRIPDLRLHGLNLEYANRDRLTRGVSDSKRPGYNDIKYFAEVDKRKFLGVGVTDVHIDEIEPASLIEDRISYVLGILEDPGRIRINPDCGLRTRSREVGEEKLRNMVIARNNVMKRI